MKFIFIILLSFLPLSLFSEFIMSYSEINGQYEGDFFGKNLSLNSDGTVLAVGSGNSYPYGSFFGEGGPRYDDTTFSNDVNVYELSDGSWIQKGDPITIDYPGFWSYSNVSISDNGQVLAIGNYNHDIGTSASVVRVFEWSGTSWTQKGNDIINRGHFVVVSKDASTVSIGSSDDISVFEWSGIDWAQKGSDIEALSDTSSLNEGLCMTLSYDGNTIGIGDKYAEIEGIRYGKVKVYEWLNNNWVQKGSDINGILDSISISSDGLILAVGAPNYENTGRVKVFEWTGSDWVQKGSDINGVNIYDDFGKNISISSDGSILAASVDGSWGMSKCVIIYSWIQSEWVKTAELFKKSNSYTYNSNMAMSSNGAMVAFNTGVADNAIGQVVTYGLNTDSILDFLTIVPMEDGNWILKCDNALAGDVVLPSSYNGTPITKIYANAFEDCDLITSIVVPEGILEIQEYAFYNCEGLAFISLPQSLSIIGNHSFSGCTSLDNIILPNAITTIEEYTFSRCRSLASISFPLNLTSIESQAFSWTGITSITIPENVSLNGYLHFSDCDKLVEINLPNTLTSIPAMAFWGCSSLTTINIPQSVQRIKLSAFRECDNLQNIQLPNSLEEIGDNAFYGCDNIDLIQLPNSLVSIGESAFENCISLKSITIPESLASLGKYSFRDCPLLEYIYFEGDNHFASSEFPFLGSNPKIYFNENTNGWDNSLFSLVWEMIEKPVARVTFNNQINEMEVYYEEVSQNYVLYSSDSLMGPYTPVEDQSIHVTTGANGQITKVFNDTVTTSKFYKLVLNLDDYHSN